MDQKEPHPNMAQNLLPRELGSRLSWLGRKVGYFSWEISEYFLCGKKEAKECLWDIWCLEVWKVADNVNKYSFYILFFIRFHWRILSKKKTKRDILVFVEMLVRNLSINFHLIMRTHKKLFIVLPNVWHLCYIRCQLTIFYTL